jgi:hypothetical protein
MLASALALRAQGVPGQGCAHLNSPLSVVQQGFFTSLSNFSGTCSMTSGSSTFAAVRSFPMSISAACPEVTLTVCSEVTFAVCSEVTLAAELAAASLSFATVAKTIAGWTSSLAVPAGQVRT